MFVRDITCVGAFQVYCHQDVLAKKQHVILVTDCISCRDTLCYLGLHFHAPGTTSRFLRRVGLFILATWVFKVLSTCSWQRLFSSSAIQLANYCWIMSADICKVVCNSSKCEKYSKTMHIMLEIFLYYLKRYSQPFLDIAWFCKIYTSQPFRKS